MYCAHKPPLLAVPLFAQRRLAAPAFEDMARKRANVLAQGDTHIQYTYSRTQQCTWYQVSYNYHMIPSAHLALRTSYINIHGILFILFFGFTHLLLGDQWTE